MAVQAEFSSRRSLNIANQQLKSKNWYSDWWNLYQCNSKWYMKTKTVQIGWLAVKICIIVWFDGRLFNFENKESSIYSYCVVCPVCTVSDCMMFLSDWSQLLPWPLRDMTGMIRRVSGGRETFTHCTSFKNDMWYHILISVL